MSSPRILPVSPMPLHHRHVLTFRPTLHSTPSLPRRLDLCRQVIERLEPKEPPLGQVRSILPPCRSQLDGTTTSLPLELGLEHHRIPGRCSDGTILAIRSTTTRFQPYPIFRLFHRPSPHCSYRHLGTNYAISASRYANSTCRIGDFGYTAAGCSCATIGIDADPNRTRHGSMQHLFQCILGSLITDSWPSYTSLFQRLDVVWIRLYSYPRGTTRIMRRLWIVNHHICRDDHRSDSMLRG